MKRLRRHCPCRVARCVRSPRIRRRTMRTCFRSKRRRRRQRHQQRMARRAHARRCIAGCRTPTCATSKSSTPSGIRCRSPGSPSSRWQRPKNRANHCPCSNCPLRRRALRAICASIIDRDAQGRLRRIDAGEQSPASTHERRLAARRERIRSRDRSHRAVVARARVRHRRALRRSMRATICRTWRNSGTATVLALEQQGARLERREIPLGGVRAKYLRLRRTRRRQRDRRTARRSALGRAHARAARTRMGRRRAESDACGRTRAARQSRASTTRLQRRFRSTSRASSSPATTRSRRSAVRTHVGRGIDAVDSTSAALTAFRLRQGDETLRNDDIDIRSAQRLREFRIESATRARRSAATSTLGYRPDSLVFLAEGSGPYVLAVGSAQARHAEYPIEPALASLRASLGKDWQPPVAKLGAAQTSGGDNAMRTPRRRRCRGGAGCCGRFWSAARC